MTIDAAFTGDARRPVLRNRTRRLLAAVLMLFGAAPFARAQPPSGHVPPSSRLRSMIHGRVVSDDGSAPLPNARVAVDLDDGSLPVLTDSEGRFVLAPSLAAKTLSAAKTGYATAHEPCRDGVEIRLARGAAITGYVLDEFGGAMPSTTVVAEQRTVANGRVRFEWRASAETDDTGAYRLFGLPAGDYVVGVSGARMILGEGAVPIPAAERPPREYYPNALNPAQAQVLAMRAATQADGINFTIGLPPPRVTDPPPDSGRSGASGAISGRIAHADGLPVRRARVELSSADMLFSPRTTTSDDDGTYEFRNVTPGRYLISATDAGFNTGRYGQRRSSDRGEVVTISAGAAAEHVDVMVPRASAVLGRVVDEFGDPVENANVRIEQVRWSGGRRRSMVVSGIASRQTDDLGRFRIFGMPPGRYVIRAVVGQSVPGYETNDLPGYMTTYFPGTAVVNEAQTVEVADSRDTLNVDFGLVRGRAGRISGRVVTSDGRPFSGVVYLIASQRSGAIAGAPGRVHTDDGSFVFDGLAPAEYVVQAGLSRQSASVEGEFGTAFVTVNGTEIPDVVVRMTAGSFVTGRVTFEGGAPPEDVNLELSSAPGDPDFAPLSGDPLARADVHDDWSFEMRGLNGPRRLKVSRAPKGWTLKAIYYGGVDVTDTPLPFGTRAQSVSNVDVVLTNRIAEVTGTILDERGRPRGDATMVAFATSPALWYAQSRFIVLADADANGTFARELPPGDYFLAAIEQQDAAVSSREIENPDFLQALAERAARVTVTDGERAATELRLPSR